jgi:N-dimethylarginine dimethylaminohydrolase
LDFIRSGLDNGQQEPSSQIQISTSCLNMPKTAHSEIGKIKSLCIKRAVVAFVSDDNSVKQWSELNYTSQPEFSKAIAEYEAFECILRKYAVEIFCLPEDESVTMDSIYCRDAAIATNKGIVICNMGKMARIHEPFAQQRAFQEHQIPILGVIKFPGTIEGGDVVWLDENTLAVGHTYRTNEEGIDQLKILLNEIGVKVMVVDMPHYRGPSDVFHLMSILSPIDKNVAVVYSPLMPIGFRNILLQKGYQLIEVPADEFESLGCNVLALEPRVCLMVSGNVKTKSLLQKAGCQVIEYSGNEISIKGGGGPTCLTRPIWREISQA